MGGPNGNDSGDPDGNGSSHGHGSSSHGNRGSEGNGNFPMNGNPQEERNSQEGEEVQMVMGDLVGMGTPQIKEEDLLEKMGTQMEEMEVQTLITVGMEVILHPQQTPPYP